jgi:hypothetical protein
MDDERAILIRAQHLAEEAIAGGALFGESKAKSPLVRLGTTWP